MLIRFVLVFSFCNGLLVEGGVPKCVVNRKFVEGLGCLLDWGRVLLKLCCCVVLGFPFSNTGLWGVRCPKCVVKRKFVEGLGCSFLIGKGYVGP